MTLGLGSKGACDGPCDECGGPCAVCNDMSGARSVVMTLPDISTITDLDPGGTCPECEDYAVPTELLAMTQADTQTLLETFAAAGCVTDATRTAGTQCGYVAEETCGTVFSIIRFAATYRTDGGDLRMFVGVLVTYQDALLFTHTYVESDDFLLASGSYQFACLALDHDGTFTMCSGSTPTIGCSAPSAYNVTMIAA